MLKWIGFIFVFLIFVLDIFIMYVCLSNFLMLLINLLIGWNCGKFWYFFFIVFIMLLFFCCSIEDGFFVIFFGMLWKWIVCCLYFCLNFFLNLFFDIFLVLYGMVLFEKSILLKMRISNVLMVGRRNVLILVELFWGMVLVFLEVWLERFEIK